MVVVEEKAKERAREDLVQSWDNIPKETLRFENFHAKAEWKLDAKRQSWQNGQMERLILWDMISRDPIISILGSPSVAIYLRITVIRFEI